MTDRRRAEVEERLAAYEAETGWLGVFCDTLTPVRIDPDVTIRCPFRGRLRIDASRLWMEAEEPRCAASVDLGPGESRVLTLRTER